jgi:hypothetical protein
METKNYLIIQLTYSRLNKRTSANKGFSGGNYDIDFEVIMVCKQ